jgi:aminomethyltransferase
MQWMDTLRTPLNDWHRVRGARMVPFGGWDMPVQYTSVIAEHQAVRTGKGLFDISHMGRLIFEGPDAEALIQRVWTNTTATMKPGQVRYGLLCNDEGGILDDVLVYRLDFWMMVVNASNREKVLTWLAAQSTGLTVSVVDRTLDWAMLALQGPAANDQTPAVELSYYYARVLPRPGGRLHIVSRTGYTGEDGSELILPADEAVSYADALVERYGFTPCGLGARDTLRLEAAMPLYGHELSETIDPLQAGLGWAVKLDKPAFIGREALLHKQQDTSRPVRIGLELASKRAAREGSAVLVEGREVGRVTSGSFSPTLGRSIAMAYVEPTFASLGTTLDVELRGGHESATVVALPFYKRGR